MRVNTDHGMISRPLSLSLLDQAPLSLVATGVNSLWLVNIHDGSRTGSLALTIATRLRVVTPSSLEQSPISSRFSV